jgi:hypothetical protein
MYLHGRVGKVVRTPESERERENAVACNRTVEKSDNVPTQRIVDDSLKTAMRRLLATHPAMSTPSIWAAEKYSEAGIEISRPA